MITCENVFPTKIIFGKGTRLEIGKRLKGWMKYVYKRHIPMFVQFAINVMGCSGSFREQERLAYDGIRALENFTKKMGLPTTMKELGIDDGQFEFMAKRAVGYKGETLGCLEKLTWKDVLNIYRIANEEDVEVLS